MLIKIYKNRNQIMEGITNAVFKKEHVEQVFAHRMAICQSCPFFKGKGEKNCVAPGTHPCCPQCGCSLKFKLRSLSSSCPEGYWEAILSEKEEDLLKQSIENQNNL